MPARVRPRLAGEEHQPVLPDLHLVTVGQRDARLDALTVDIGAVEASDVGDGEDAVGPAPELHVTAGDGHVVEEDVALADGGRLWSARCPAGSGFRSWGRGAPPAGPSPAEARRRRPGPRGRAAGSSGPSPPPRRPRSPRSRSWTSSRRTPLQRGLRPEAVPRSWNRTGSPRRPGSRTCHTPARQTLRPYSRLMVHRNLCGPTLRGQQKPYRDHPRCHRPKHRPRRGRADARHSRRQGPHGIPLGGPVPRGVIAVVLAALAEQPCKKTHGRFPSHETDPPVGQDRPSMLSFGRQDAQTTSLDSRQFPSRDGHRVRRPPARPAQPLT